MTATANDELTDQALITKGRPNLSVTDRNHEGMTEKEMIRRWVDAWKVAGPELEKIRLREVRDQDNLLSLRLLARMFNQATRSQPPRESSGLVEMQRYFAKLPQ